MLYLGASTSVIDIYHGSSHKVLSPLPHYGRNDNDYSQGFYCTSDKSMAGEWACQRQTNGFINEYTLDMHDLSILRSSDKKHNILNWIATLVRYRTLDRVNNHEALDFLFENYSIDTSKYDIVIGLRADDSYFTYAKDFINDAITLQTLEKAIRLGKLGTQIVIKSDKAFSRLAFQESISADKNVYYPLFAKRDAEARGAYQNMKRQPKSKGIIATDIVRNPKVFRQYLKVKETDYGYNR